MMAAARESAYKKGFQDGVILVTSCIPSGTVKLDLDFGEACETS